MSDEASASTKALATDTALVRILLLVGHPAHKTSAPAKALPILEQSVRPPPHEGPLMHHGSPYVSGLRHQLSLSNSLKAFPLSS